MKTKSEISSDKFDKFINGEKEKSESVKTTPIKPTKTSRLKNPDNMVYQVFLPRELQHQIKKAAILSDMTINDFYLTALKSKLQELNILH